MIKSSGRMDGTCICFKILFCPKLFLFFQLIRNFPRQHTYMIFAKYFTKNFHCGQNYPTQTLQIAPCFMKENWYCLTGLHSAVVNDKAPFSMASSTYWLWKCASVKCHISEWTSSFDWFCSSFLSHLLTKSPNGDAVVRLSTILKIVFFLR